MNPNKGNLLDSQHQLPGTDLKNARGLDKDLGNNQHESGTDQLVEDTKKEREKDSDSA